MSSQQAFTVGMIRILRQLGPLRRRTRMPRQQQPDLLRLEYYKALLPFVRGFLLTAEDRSAILRMLSVERRNEGRMDAPMRPDASLMIDRFERIAEDDLGRKRIEETARRFGERVSGFQREQLDKQARASLGIPLRMVEAPVVARLEGFAAENAALIKDVSQRYFDRIRGDVMEAFERGTHPSELAEMLEERDGMAERDVRRIARDQIGKLNGQFNEERQTQLGVTSYIWRTANDKRVRDEHRTREGRTYKWASPPAEGHPGEPVQCRCYAEPVFDDILEGL